MKGKRTFNLLIKIQPSQQPTSTSTDIGNSSCSNHYSVVWRRQPRSKSIKMCSWEKKLDSPLPN